MTPNEHPVLFKLAKLAIFITRHIVVKQREEEFIAISRQCCGKIVLEKRENFTIRPALILSLCNLFSFFHTTCTLTTIFYKLTSDFTF